MQRHGFGIYSKWRERNRLQSFLLVEKRPFAFVYFVLDEIDAIGKKRGEGQGSGSAERESGLMQLLVEMDGAHDDQQARPESVFFAL